MSSFVAFRSLGPEKRAGPGYGLSQVTVETGPAGDLARPLRPPPTDADILSADICAAVPP